MDIYIGSHKFKQLHRAKGLSLKKKGGVCMYPGERKSTWLTDTRQASSSAHVIPPPGRERHNDYESGVIRVPVSKRSQQSGSLYKITQYFSVHTISWLIDNPRLPVYSSGLHSFTQGPIVRNSLIEAKSVNWPGN